MMKAFIVILSMLIIDSQSLKIHNTIRQNSHKQETVYDEQKYLIELAERQNKFKVQILSIQNDFLGINLMLNDTNMNKNDKKIKLNEALADERDSLIQTQANLNIPYELKSCQCLNLTDKKKIELTDQLKQVNLKIQQLEKVSSEATNKHCEVHQCPLMEQINIEIQMLKNYQRIMQDTIGSKCCKVVKYEYRDNLDANNWHFGNTTQSKYQAKIYQKEQTSNIKLQPCPYTFPFVKTDSNECFNCPAEKTLFNLDKRICDKDCGESTGNQTFVLNLTSHVCGLNKVCPSGQYYDQISKKCTIMPQDYNESQCPPDRPFWDPLSLSCQACPLTTPYFDLVIKKCRKCTQLQRWNQNTRTCGDAGSQCSQGQIFNSITQKCELFNNNPDTHSLCPPDRPNWNQFTFSCDACNNQKTFYDPILKQCRVCTSQQSFNSNTRQCVLKTINIICASDEFYNQNTKTCDKRGTTSMCPPLTPYWDSINMKCLKCPTEKPFFNQKSHECETCPLNSTWSVMYNLCVQQCASGQEYNIEYKKCVKSNKICLEKETFSYELDKCIAVNCDSTQPYWNQTENKCQPCPSATVFNYVTSSCDKNTRIGNVSVCFEEKPVWNSEYLRCEACPLNTEWNASLNKCMQPSIATYHLNSDKISNHHRLQVSASTSQKFVEGEVYGNEQISYQHKWLHAGML